MSEASKNLIINLRTGFIEEILPTDPRRIDSDYCSPDGRLLYVAQYPELFELIGTAYGSGEIEGMFRIPDVYGKPVLEPKKVSVGSVCPFCEQGINPTELDDPEVVYREVTSWVHGPKLQGPVLRTQTGRLAHEKCIKKLIEGQSPDQESLPGLEE